MITQRNLNLRDYNSYRVESICKEAYFPESVEDVIKAVRQTGGEAVVIGGGYNIILSQNYYERPFIIFDHHFSKFSFEEERVFAQAGISMRVLSETARNNSLSGLEVFYDIPSSFGGAIVMNAGASGEEIKDVLLSVNYLDLKTMEIRTILSSEVNFSYRNSFFQRHLGKMIILDAIMQLKGGEKEKINEKMVSIYNARISKQPKGHPNAGSVFKRPAGMFVGPMIERLGLKGLSIGGAKVSEKHAGFIVNNGGATGSDIISLIELLREKVYREYNVLLEIEQRII